MRNLLTQPLLLLLINILKILEARRILRDERALAQQRQDVLRQALLALEAGHVLEEALARDALERVADLALEVLGEVRDGLAALLFGFGDALFVFAAGVLSVRLLCFACDAVCGFGLGWAGRGVRVSVKVENGDG